MECVYQENIHIDPESGLVDKVIIYGVSDVYVSQADFDTFDPLDGVYARTRKGVNVPVTANLVSATTDKKIYQYVAVGDEDTATAMRNVYLWAAPTITAPDETIYQGDTWGVMHDVTAVDFAGNDITNLVTWSGSYDTETDGTYTITYSANSHGFVGTKDRILTVLPWAPPNLIVPPYVTVIMRETYDPMDGVSAEDYDGNDITADVTYSGTVDTDRLGTYNVTFSVTDSKGRTTTKTQVVEVVQSPYATYLFTDGTLVINALRTDLTALEAIHGTMLNQYDPGPYDFHWETDTPWYAQRNSVKKAEFGSVFKPQSTAWLFSELRNLEDVDLTNLDTSACTDFSNMFIDCLVLEEIDASKIDVSSAETLKRMFLNCWKVNVLDLTSWDTSNVMNFDSMFFSCADLATIYASTDFVIPTGATGVHMFSNCNDLAGGMGTQFDGNIDNLERAYIDEGVLGQDGYFTDKRAMVTTLYADGYLVINELPNHRETNMANHGKVARQFAPTVPANNWEHGWNHNTNVKNVVFDANVAPTQTRYWFDGCSNLLSIDFHGFDSSNLTDMHAMFYGCKKLASMDLSMIDTSNVTDMSSMFQGCNAMTATHLAAINNWDTSNVTTMSAMFSGNGSYPNIKLTFDTSNVEAMNAMFGYSPGFETIDISELDLSSVTDASFMFVRCENLTTIYTDCPFSWGATAPTTNNMFYLDTKLVGGQGTTYSVPGGAYAKCDGGTADPGYFSPVPTAFGTYLYPNGRLIINEAVADHEANVQAFGNPIGTYDAWDPVDNPYHFEGYYECPWSNEVADITSVYFGSAVAPDDMSYWFANMVNLNGIGNSNLLDTSGVTKFVSTFSGIGWTGTIDLHSWSTQSAVDMNHMFAGSENLEHIILTDWDMSHVTDMSCMFDGTASLLDMPDFGSNIDTSSVTNMSFLFGGSGVPSVDLTGWDTSNVTDMSRMFMDCANLSSATLPIDTSSVTDMEYMFWGCENLHTLDLTTFTSDSTPAMYGMFVNCFSLERINATPDFDGNGSFRVFEGNNTLVGGKGTQYSDSHKDGDYAHCDGGSSNPGYFTCNNGLYGTVLYSDGTFIFNEKIEDHDANVALHGAESEVFDPMDENNPYVFTSQFTIPWKTGSTHINITSVEIGAPMKPTSMAFWFSDLYNARSISGLDKIDLSDCSSLFMTFFSFGESASSTPTGLDLSMWDTSSVTNMERVFENAKVFDDINLSGWDTSRVTTFERMFAFTSLGMISLLDFDTSSATTLKGMFAASSFAGLQLANFNTSNVTDMSQIFMDSKSLRGVDIRGWDTSNATTMEKMFWGDTGLIEILASHSFVAVAGPNMFTNCTSLVGGQGTTYDSTKTDSEYARLDNPPSAPGYFSSM